MWPFITVFAAVVVAVVYQEVVANATNGRDALRKRLAAYDLMKSGKRLSPWDSDEELLPVRQHEVLLGILKKVEAKNASLFSALTFVSAATVAVSGLDAFDEHKGVLAALFLFTLPCLWASLRGMRQVDQKDMPAKPSSSRERAVVMQRMLMDDLLQKEAAFDFAYKGAFLGLTLGLVCFATLLYRS